MEKPRTSSEKGLLPAESPPAIDEKQIWRDLKEHGFSIVHGFVSERDIGRVRDFWVNKFSEPDVARGRITWSPYLGQSNHIGFSDDAFQYLFRSCDFFWNEPFDVLTRQIGLRMNTFRNQLLGKDPQHGTRFSDGRHGVFLTASYYPPQVGFMDMHRDGVAKQNELVHVLVPLTFRGTEYAEGGMRIIDRAGVERDIEVLVKPGDAIVYDGSLTHGVGKIMPIPGKNIGRLQISPFPTYFRPIEENPRALNAIPLATYLFAKAACFKNGIRMQLGLKPSLR